MVLGKRRCSSASADYDWERIQLCLTYENVYINQGWEGNSLKETIDNWR